MEILIIAVLLGIITAIVANTKGRNVFGWFVFGTLFFIGAIILVLVLPALNKPQAANVVSIKRAAVEEADEFVGMSAETADRFKLVIVAAAVVGAVFFFGANV
jgi:hypothetical protein